jgi:protein-L-isoaspartate(D-aspartate) O-methyltransferase
MQKATMSRKQDVRPMYFGRDSLSRLPARESVEAPLLPKVVPATLNSPRQREVMVQRLRETGIRHPLVLTAMESVGRHDFLEAGLASRAYEDLALPIGHEQTISRPSVVARMIELALGHPNWDEPNRRKGLALEIGTGCGYQAAVMTACFSQVISIERIRALHELAIRNLRPYRLYDLSLVFGDGMQGAPTQAPFDAVIIAAAGIGIPEPLLMQLTLGGRLVAPVANTQGEQTLCLVERVSQDQWRQTMLEEASFVPLRSGVR